MLVLLAASAGVRHRVSNGAIDSARSCGRGELALRLRRARAWGCGGHCSRAPAAVGAGRTGVLLARHGRVGVSLPSRFSGARSTSRSDAFALGRCSAGGWPPPCCCVRAQLPSADAENGFGPPTQRPDQTGTIARVCSRSLRSPIVRRWLRGICYGAVACRRRRPASTHGRCSRRCAVMEFGRTPDQIPGVYKDVMRHCRAAGRDPLTSARVRAGRRRVRPGFQFSAEGYAKRRGGGSARGSAPCSQGSLLTRCPVVEGRDFNDADRRDGEKCHSSASVARRLLYDAGGGHRR